jgi:hypothetical protein
MSLRPALVLTQRALNTEGEISRPVTKAATT